jgi:hypothetical protein
VKPGNLSAYAAQGANSYRRQKCLMKDEVNDEIKTLFF